MQFEDGLWYTTDGKLCIQKDKQRQVLLKAFTLCKDINDMCNFIKQNYWWPEQNKSIKDFLIESKMCKDHSICLSDLMNKLAYNPYCLKRLSAKNLNRVKILENYIKDCDPCKTAEFKLMKKLIEKYVLNGTMYLVAIEYYLDNGNKRKKAKGDIILASNDTIYVIECKLLKPNLDSKYIDTIARRRLDKVKEQSISHATQISMWIKMLSFYDSHYDKLLLFPVVPAIYTEESDSYLTVDQLNSGEIVN